MENLDTVYCLTGELGNDNGPAHCTWRHLGRNVVRGEGVMQAVLHGAAVTLCRSHIS